MGAARVTFLWQMESQKALGSDSNIGVALLLAFYASEVRSIFTSRSFSLLCFTFMVAWRENNLMMLQNSDKFLGVFEPLG